MSSIIAMQATCESCAAMWSANDTSPNRPARVVLAKPRLPPRYRQAAAMSRAFAALSTCGTRMPDAPQSSTDRMLASLGSPTRTMPAMFDARAASTMTSMAPRSMGACS